MLKINFSRLTNESFAALTQMTITTVNQTGDASIINNPVFTLIAPAYEQFEILINKPAYSGLGKRAKKDDKIRDKYFRGLYAIVRSMSVFADDAKGQKAAEILPFFKQVGNIDSKTYSEQTAALNKFFSDMDSQTNQTILEETGIKNFYQKVRNAQNVFEEHYLQQINEDSQLRQGGTASQKRRLLEENMSQFHILVNAMKNQPVWSDLYADLKQLETGIKH
ncbi:MAG: DUF6261 family protein [Bacteroidales bacterium]|jgi:hypothetical protein|nr:DUF6261 family protein [Bacteroidales bacterium]